MSINIKRALFEVKYQGVKIISIDQNVTISGCSFVNSFCNEKRGGVFVNAFSIDFNKNCGMKAKSNSEGGFLTVEANHKAANIISYCSAHDCVSKMGPEIYQLFGNMTFSHSNVSMGEGVYGGYEDEYSHAGCVIKHIIFHGVTATKKIHMCKQKESTKHII